MIGKNIQVTEEATKGRIGWIDAAKGASIILVTLYHVSLFGRALDFHVSLMLGINDLLTPIRMPLFFAAAGLTSGSVLFQSWRSLWSRRISLYVWVFTLWVALSFVFFGAIPHPRFPNFSPSIALYLQNLVVPENELWFLWCLGLFYIATWCTVRFPKIIISLGLTAALIGFVSGELTQGSSTALPLPIANALKYFIFFAGAALYRSPITALVTGRFIATAMLMIAYAILAVSSHFLDGRAIGGLVKLAAAFVGVFAAANLLYNVLGLAPRLGGWLRWIGERTLPIYLLQSPVIASLYYVGMAIVGRGAATLTVLPFVVFAMMIPIALLFHRLTQRRAFWLYSPPEWARVSIRPIADAV